MYIIRDIETMEVVASARTFEEIEKLYKAIKSNEEYRGTYYIY